jgi:hypothetical protein
MWKWIAVLIAGTKHEAVDGFGQESRTDKHDIKVDTIKMSSCKCKRKTVKEKCCGLLPPLPSSQFAIWLPLRHPEPLWFLLLLKLSPLLQNVRKELQALDHFL